MRTSLTILTDELRRLKAEGVKSVSVSDESLAALRRSSGRVRERAAASKTAAPPRVREAAGAAANKAEVPAKAKAAEPAGLPPPPTVALPAGDKAVRWAALRELVLNDPTCRAHVRPGKKVVLGVGSLDARIMFVGEAPGAEEEIQGEPFVGPAGKLLDRMIGGMGLSRAQVYIGNIMNWRPEMPAGADGVQYGNRPPTAGEMAYCLPYLRAQIEIVNPEFLVALGATAAQGLLGPGTFRALGEIRGRWKDFAGKPLMITYHPSYILRNPVNSAKRLIWEDLLKVMERSGLEISAKQRGYFLEP
jgi:uracil-DNA glycosylase family 4